MLLIDSYKLSIKGLLLIKDITRGNIMRIDYKKDQPKEYTAYGFSVPENTGCIEVIFKNPSMTNSIDLALRSPDGFHGWSGGTKERIIITEEYATEGYFTGLPAGEWEILLGFFKLSEDNFIDIHIECHPNTERWLAGDLHMHSVHSDGIYTVREVMAHCKEVGLDFMCLTDHNAMSGHDELTGYSGLITIPGVELTSYYGHANVWNISEPLEKVLINNDKDFEEVYTSLSPQSILSLNHPFFKDPWQMSLKHPFTHVEIWNGFWDIGNVTCLEWWHSQLCEGKRLVAVGGSDSHGKNPDKWFGLPTTRVKTTTYTREAILNGIVNGNVCICLSPEAPYIHLTIDGSKLYIHYHQFIPCHLKLYTDKGLLVNILLEEANFGEVELEDTYAFIRGELWQVHKELPFAFTNPLWL